MTKSKIYADEQIPNTGRRFGSSKAYYPVMVNLFGTWEPALFTDAQVGDAVARARHQPEDAPRLSFWQKIWMGITP